MDWPRHLVMQQLGRLVQLLTQDIVQIRCKLDKLEKLLHPNYISQLEYQEQFST